MRRSKTISLAEAMKDYIREMNLENKLREVELISSWEETVGRAIASRTSKVYIKDGTLYVHLKSSVVRNELVMVRETLKQRLNEKAGAEIVREIILK